MSQTQEKFDKLLGKIKDMFVVSQVIATNNFSGTAELEALQAENAKLKAGLTAVRKSDEIMEARRIAEDALEGE